MVYDSKMKKIELFSFVCLFVSNLVEAETVKRVINGLPLSSHNVYYTHYMVALVQTHACMTDQFDHKLLDCRHEVMCGGSLISVDFVLTACHCIVYENWYAKTVQLPGINRYGPDEFPGYHIFGRVLNRRRKKKDPVVYRVSHTVRHALLNSLTLFAGHTEILEKAPQRRHGASFFPHHLCAERHQRFFPDRWRKYDYEHDVGLVKTCYPFEINKDVKLAPLPKYEDMEKTFQKVMLESQVCLIAGWGTVLKPHYLWTPLDVVEGYGETDPDILQHAFRYMNCIVSCNYLPGEPSCTFCSHHHGSYVNALGNGDSGSPVLCDGFVVAHNVAGDRWDSQNHSWATHYSVNCAKDFITPEHLRFLKAKRNLIFHWIDGHPVTRGPGP